MLIRSLAVLFVLVSTLGSLTLLGADFGGSTAEPAGSAAFLVPSQTSGSYEAPLPPRPAVDPLPRPALRPL